jgi:hypothetical protein
LGGTSVTITGENFSEETNENPVMIGNADCIIQSSSTTQIICQIEKRPVIDFDDYESKEARVSVFLRLSDVASCGIESCDFIFEKPQAEVKSLSQAYDITVADQQIVTVTGTGFKAGDKEPVMTIDGVELTLLTLEDEVATFLLVSVLDKHTANIEIQFEDGLPQGYNTVMTQLWFGQKLYSVQPSVGSAGGTKLTLSLAAVGSNTDLSDWVLQARSKINGKWTWYKICDDFTFVSYGTLTCITKAMQVPARSSLRIKPKSGKIWCNNNESYDDNCRFQQLDS